MCNQSPVLDWGLRDYGTAAWEGGDEGCDHVEPGTNRGKRDELENPPAGWAERSKGSPYRDCLKCGATRIDQQLGLESTPDEYITRMVAVFREVWRVLRDDGCLFINIGDSYAGGGGYYPDAPSNQNGSISSGGAGRGGAKTQGATRTIPGLKPKDLVGIPWRLALALQADGWYLRSDIIWSKPNPMPESVTDRPTKSHEYLFLLAKRERYYFDAEAVREANSENSHAQGPNGGPRSRQVARHQTHVDVGSNGTMGHDLDNYISDSGRNIRSVFSAESQLLRLRSDLTSEQRMYIIKELIQRGLL